MRQKRDFEYKFFQWLTRIFFCITVIIFFLIGRLTVLEIYSNFWEPYTIVSLKQDAALQMLGKEKVYEPVYTFDDEGNLSITQNDITSLYCIASSSYDADYHIFRITEEQFDQLSIGKTVYILMGNIDERFLAEDEPVVIKFESPEPTFLISGLDIETRVTIYLAAFLCSLFIVASSKDKANYLYTNSVRDRIT